MADVKWVCIDKRSGLRRRNNGFTQESCAGQRGDDCRDVPAVDAQVRGGKRMPAGGIERLAYQLTNKGLALRPVLRAIRDWGLKWKPGTRANLES